MNRNVSSEKSSNIEASKQVPVEGNEARVDSLESQPLPRPKRLKRRSKEDRGLPGDSDLALFAVAYLNEMHRLYPEASASGAIPLASPEVIAEMVEDFKSRHRGGSVDASMIRRQLKALGLKKGAAAYTRFSCLNSNITSNIDQLVKCLNKAFSEGRYIPWEYVYADFAVTGLDATRQGYCSLKKILSDSAPKKLQSDSEQKKKPSDPEQLIETLYIDDFTRASRDHLEWWKLAHLSKRLRKRMIGASDNFDLSSEDWDFKITIYGLLSRLFIKSLQQKVSRGMKGAAGRQTCLGKLSLGFTRRQKVDSTGKPMVGADGLPINEPCVDLTTSYYRLLMFELYVKQNWSMFRIAKHFSELKVDGWDGWTTSAIKKLLLSETAIGVFTWNKTRSEYNFEEERYEVVQNPQEEWVVTHSPECEIVPPELFRAAKEKNAARSRPTGPRMSRNEKHPTTLFSGTLYCACCPRNELKLIRSKGNQKQMGSVTGIMGAHGCLLTTSKSVRVIEECLLGYLSDDLLTVEVVTDLVNKANEFLDGEIQKPIPETRHLKEQIAKSKKEIDRLVRRSARTDDDTVADGYEKEIKRLSQMMFADQEALKEASLAQQRQIERLDMATALTMLKDVRSVLREDVAISGPAIRELTGPIQIHQEPVPGRDKCYRWVARFTPQVGALVRKLATNEGGQFAAAALSQEDSVEVVLEELPVYERRAKEFQRLNADGASAQAIAAMYGLYPTTVHQALKFAETGERPNWGPKRKPKGTGGKPTLYKELAPEVVRMIDKERMTFRDVAERLGVGDKTVQRAYDYLKPEAVCTAVTNGTRPKRRQPTHLPHGVFERIRELAGTGVSIEKDRGRGWVQREHSTT